MGQASYQNTKQIISALEKYLPDYDLSQGENASSISYALAESAIRTDARFRLPQTARKSTISQGHPAEAQK